MSPDDPRHGTTAGHAAGCRLTCCREARNSDERQRRKHREVLGIIRTVDKTGTVRRIQALWRPWLNAASNLLLACGSGSTGCHGLIERERASAYGYGWLLREGAHPLEVSVVLGNPTWPTRTRLV